MVGLGNVNNTSDKDKPLSDETKAMFETVAKAVDITISKKADKLDPIFTGNVQGITKTMVGLGNVDNTSDKEKHVSDATQSALSLKAPLASPTFTGNVQGITKTMVSVTSITPLTRTNRFPTPRNLRST